MGDTNEGCEKLFLLEVLVDSLFVSNSSLNLTQDVISNLTDTCVLFQFLHYPPLIVCESDFIGTNVKHDDNSHITFKSGKSCFFSLRTPRGRVRPVSFNIKVTVIRRLKEGVLPDKLEIGKTSIELSNEFTELLSVDTDENCDTLPLSRNKKGIFEIEDSSKKKVGSVTAFIRLSCFGKLIITQFSLNKEDAKSFLFKGTDTSKLCQTGVGGDKPNSGDKGNVVRPSAEMPPTGQKGLKEDQAINTFQERRCSQPPFKMVDQSKIPNYGDRSAQPARPDYGGMMCSKPTRPCGCPMDCMFRSPVESPRAQYSSGRPANLARALCDCRSGRNQDLTPGEVGLEDDKVVFQLPLKREGDPMTDREKQDSAVYYRLTSAEETKAGVVKNTVNINSNELAAKGAVGPVSGLPVDDKHDIFMLKIGKKCEGDKKRNLELELRTPKMKEPKPPTTDQDTQYLESDIPKAEKRKSSSKKKGGKKDKKGKGKKK